MAGIKSRVELRETTARKYFADPEDFARELRVYQLRLAMIPALLDFREPEWILLARVQGRPYLDGDLREEDVSRLAETIAAFHQATLQEGLCLCHWDNQPRNILDDGVSFHLIDFSESRFAPLEDDLTHLLLFWASEFSPSRLARLARAFVQTYPRLIPLETGRWQTSLAESRQRFDLRRARHNHLEPHLGQGQLETNRRLLARLL